MGRHAFIVITHGHADQVQFLLDTLNTYSDRHEVGIYLHVDTKSRERRDLLALTSSRAPLNITSRYRVYWGCYSVVEAIFCLLRRAVDDGPYDYYHVLSGHDFPLHPIDSILDFYDASGKEFISFERESVSDHHLDRAIRFHLPWCPPGYRGRFFFYKGARLLEMVQRALNISSGAGFPRYQKGEAWSSITHPFAEHVLTQESLIRKDLRFAAFPDELFMQTLALNSPWKDNLYHEPGRAVPSNARLIDWDRGTPYQFTRADFPELIESDKMFVRKIDAADDPALLRDLALALGIFGEECVGTN